MSKSKNQPKAEAAQVNQPAGTEAARHEVIGDGTGEALPEANATEGERLGAAVQLNASADAAPMRADRDAALQVKARVLTNCAFGKANDVYTFENAAAAAAAGSDVDANPEAVAYAESLLGN